jgi:hypothetical protein
MANPRPEEKSNPNVHDGGQRTAEKATEQTARIGLAAAKAGEQVAQASAHMMQQNAEMLQNTCRHGLDIGKTIADRSADQLSKTLGLTGDEAQRAIDRSTRNAETIVYSASAIARGVNGISQEYFALLRHQLETSLDRMHDIWRCRTPQDLAVVQTELMRDTIRGALDSGRRIADVSLKVADDAGKHITETIERVQRAA